MAATAECPKVAVSRLVIAPVRPDTSLLALFVAFEPRRHTITSMPASERAQLLRQRLRAHDLDGGTRGLAGVAVLLCGLRDSDHWTGDASLALRLGSADAVAEARATGRLVTAMTLRGAPHVVRTGDVTNFRAALVPATVDDLEATTGPLPSAVAERDDPLAEVAAAVDEVFSAGITKAELSAAATLLLPPALTPYCERCATSHPIDGLFRLATLRAWLLLVPGERTQTFTRLDGHQGAATPRGTAQAREALLSHAVQVSAPADPRQLAAWLGLSPASVADFRPKVDLVFEPSTSSRPQPRTRLLPPRDPWLRGSNRDWLLGSNCDRCADVFRSLGAPGIVLIEGEVAGTARFRKSGRRLQVTLDLWRLPGPLNATTSTTTRRSSPR